MLTVFRISILATILAFAAQANASIYNFTYSDAAGDVANGTLVTVPSGVDGLSQWATSGTLNLTSSADGNASVGTYSLIPIGPSPTLSPAGGFIVDNLVYPGNDAASGVNPGIGTNPSYLTNWGLLFGQPGTGPRTELNIWGNGGGDYGFGAFDPTSGYSVLQFNGGTFTLTEVPEPATMVIWGVGALGFSVVAARRRKLAAK